MDKDRDKNIKPKIFSENRSKIYVISRAKKRSFIFDVPIETTLGEAYEMLSFLRDSILEQMEKQKKEEEDIKDIKESIEKDECKATLHEEKDQCKATLHEEKDDLVDTLIEEEKKD